MLFVRCALSPEQTLDLLVASHCIATGMAQTRLLSVVTGPAVLASEDARKHFMPQTCMESLSTRIEADCRAVQCMHWMLFGQATSVPFGMPVPQCSGGARSNTLMMSELGGGCCLADSRLHEMLKSFLCQLNNTS